MVHEECPVCINTVTVDDDPGIIECPGCSFRVCGDCFRRRILTEARDPTCMNCKKELSVDFIFEMNPRPWLLQSFLPHMGSLLLEKERSLIPYTQEAAASTLKARRLRQEFASLPSDKKLKKKHGKNGLEAFYEEKEWKDAKKSEIRSQINDLEGTIHTGGGPTKKDQLPIAKCRVEGCRGFVNRGHVCGICETVVCKECLTPHEEETGGGHECKHEDLELANILRKDSKACPSCFTPIIKAGGCDQMFCTSCNTAFSWTTGKIETGPVHNPHYYDWLFRRGAAADADADAGGREGVCDGQLPPLAAIRDHRMRFVHRCILHVRHVVLPEYAEDRVRDNIDLRIRFILDEITEEEWKSVLLYREKKRLKNRAYRGVLETFTTVATDLVIRHSATQCEAILGEMIEVCEHIIPCGDRIAAIHGGSIPAFFSEFESLRMQLFRL
jgi:hypothetical protein